MTNISQSLSRSNQINARDTSKLGIINVGLILFTLSIIIVTIFYAGVLVGAHMLRLNEDSILITTKGNNLLRKRYSVDSTSTTTSSNSDNPLLGLSTSTSSSSSSSSYTKYSSRMSVQIPKQELRLQPPSSSSSSSSTVRVEDLNHSSLEVMDENSFLTLPASLDSSVNLVIGVWIYLAGNRKNMRTIISNKATGCDSNRDALFGVALYVNGWESEDRRLYAEYGNKESGCHKLHSGDHLLESNRWYHVALYSDNLSNVLFINGKAVITDSVKENSPRELQLHRPFIVGQYDPASFATSYPLHGRISRVALVFNICKRRNHNIYAMLLASK
jgi:hypothetical protein